MTKKSYFIKKIFVFSLLIFFLNENVFFAQNQNNGAVRLPVTNRRKSFFYGIENGILNDVENGSSSSLKNAISLLRKADSSQYKQNELVLLNVATQIMKILWKSERIIQDDFPEPEANSYTGALNSAKNGIFDTSTGNTDFLSTILPAFVVLSENANISPEVLNQCRIAVDASLKINPSSIMAAYLSAVIYKMNGEYSKAEETIFSVYDSESNNFEITLEYAEILTYVNKSEESVRILKNLYENNSLDSQNSGQNIQILRSLSYSCFKAGLLDEAEEYVARVLQQTPNDLEFVLFRAKILIEKKDYIHAVSLLDVYERQNPENLDYLILRSKVQLDWSKNTAAATNTVEKALKLYPENQELLMTAARISSETDAPVAGKYADELASLVLEKNPENQEAKLYALDALIKHENWQDAYKISSSLINTYFSPELLLRHVNVCINAKKNSEALSVATSAYNQNPGDENVILAYVASLSGNSRYDEAMSLVEKLLPSASSRLKSSLYYYRSDLQRTEEKKLADLRSSLISNPRNSDSLFSLYEYYYDKQDYKKAQYYLRQVVAIKPNDSSVRQLNENLTKLIK